MSSPLQTVLAAYLQTMPVERRAVDLPLITNKVGTAFWANGLCQLMLKLYEAAELGCATSYSTRHTFITTLAHRGANVRVLAELAGHKTIATTERCIELSENRLRAAVELA